MDTQIAVVIFAILAAFGLVPVVAATTTSPLNLLSAYADEDIKLKGWSTEDGFGGGAARCDKHTEDDCKDFKDTFGGNVNEVARELCHETSDGDKCKQVNLNKDD